MDRDQRLLVAATGALFRSDETGAAFPMPLVGQPELPSRMLGIDVDARGRILLTTSAGTVLRYFDDGTLDARVGFAEGGARGRLSAAGGCSSPTADPGQTLEEDYVLRLAP